MKKLTIKNFSCIKSAEVEFAKLTIFIGPQASGKSVICKIAYFFLQAADQQGISLVKLQSFEKYSDSVKEKFVDWFPPSAWGFNKFQIDYECGGFAVQLVRKTYKKAVSDGFRLKFSDAFKMQYEELLASASKPQDKGTSVEHDFRREWSMQESSRTSLNKLMGSDFPASQMFVPAGRSFFTSIGKAIAAFEQGRVLDPLILRFGRIYTAYKNDRIYYGSDKANDMSSRKLLTANLQEIFGGKLHMDGDREYVVTSDGRQIPLSALSSGQQELLPLITVLPHMYGARSGLCYIEEPEAHLFPLAQSMLLEAMVSLLSSPSSKTELVITTHSPYVLAKVNNLIKAGSLGRRFTEGGRKKLEAIVPRRSWLVGRSVQAYAIQDGIVRSIKGADNLIDADYLDGVSGDMHEEFAELLELETSGG